MYRNEADPAETGFGECLVDESSSSRSRAARASTNFARTIRTTTWPPVADADGLEPSRADLSAAKPTD